MSGANHIELMIYETDRDNVRRRLLEHITYAEPDWDIDRAGSKGRLSIGAHRSVLRDGMWVATHIRIVPEVGDIVDMQTGHFRLDMPNELYDGAMSVVDGAERVMQEAVGDDIVRLLADADLPFTFVTPRNASVMSDVLALIQLGTCGKVGANLVANGLFQDGTTGWSTSSGYLSLSVYTISPEIYSTDNFASLRANVASGTPSGTVVGAIQAIDIPYPTERLFVSGFARNWSSRRFDSVIELRFSTPDGYKYAQPEPWVHTPNVWYRTYGFVDVPPEWDGSGEVRIYLLNRTREALPSGDTFLWDDIQVRTVTNAPIPKDRISLPPVNTLATTRIQTTGGEKIGTVAINADRLRAISHHAINATFDGTLTSSPSRDLASTTAVRTYTENDYRFRNGPRELQRSAQNRFNTVTAVKESFDDTPPLVVTVWNDDLDDAWSVHHLGNVGRPGGSLQVPDAVDADALEAAARAELARATMQEELILTVAPDPELTVYDVIEITGGPEPLQGRWLIQALSGVTPQQPYTQIQARRSRSSIGVTHG